jgi:hypothetical protein
MILRWGVLPIRDERVFASTASHVLELKVYERKHKQARSCRFPQPYHRF